MNPYYQDDWVTLYCGDCFDILPALPRESVALIITDPPYGVRFQSNFRQRSFAPIAGDDGSLSVLDALALAVRCLRDSRHVYVFGLSDWGVLPIGGSAELIWDKRLLGLGDLSIPWSPSHETINFGVYRPSAENRKEGRGRLSARIRRGSVLRSDRANATAVTKHPTEKPVDILRQMIESSSMLGETVLDPFAGSGSTLVAARLEERHAIGIEIDEGYCRVIADRMRPLSCPLFSALDGAAS